MCHRVWAAIVDRAARRRKKQRTNQKSKTKRKAGGSRSHASKTMCTNLSTTNTSRVWLIFSRKDESSSLLARLSNMSGLLRDIHLGQLGQESTRLRQFAVDGFQESRLYFAGPYVRFGVKLIDVVIAGLGCGLQLDPVAVVIEQTVNGPRHGFGDCLCNGPRDCEGRRIVRPFYAQIPPWLRGCCGLLSLPAQSARCVPNTKNRVPTLVKVVISKWNLVGYLTACDFMIF